MTQGVGVGEDGAEIDDGVVGVGAGAGGDGVRGGGAGGIDADRSGGVTNLSRPKYSTQLSTTLSTAERLDFDKDADHFRELLQTYPQAQKTEGWDRPPFGFYGV
jgi:hypothetical protein